MGQPEQEIPVLENDEALRHEEYGSGAYEDVAEAFDQDAEVLASNLGWE